MSQSPECSEKSSESGVDAYFEGTSPTDSYGESEYVTSHSDWSYSESECLQYSSDKHVVLEYSETFTPVESVEMEVVPRKHSFEIGPNDGMFTCDMLVREIYGGSGSSELGFDFTDDDDEDGSEFSETPPNTCPTIDAPSDKLEGVDENKVCKVCFCRIIVNKALSPCGHVQLCRVCITAFQPGKKCPFCRCVINKIIDQL